MTHPLARNWRFAPALLITLSCQTRGPFEDWDAVLVLHPDGQSLTLAELTAFADTRVLEDFDFFTMDSGGKTQPDPGNFCRVATTLGVEYPPLATGMHWDAP